MASNGSEEEVKKHDEDLLHHYDQVATRYNQAWFYQDGSPYQTWLADAISLRLQAFPTSRVVDLGAGTGNFSVVLHHKCGLQTKILCVDPSEPLLSQAKQFPEVETLLADGLQFVQMKDQSYDRLLFKEVVHHFSPSELPIVFEGAFQQFRHAGRLLIMTRPHDSSHYPFFTKAHQAWSSAQLHEDIYANALKAAGFDVTLEYQDYTVEMPASQWLDMVKGRFWSNFNSFSEEEMEEGLREIREKLGVSAAEEGKEEMIKFPDRIVFITGIKADTRYDKDVTKQA